MLYKDFVRERIRHLTKVKDSEGYPCTLSGSVGKNLKDYKIYGNIDGVGDKTKNLLDYRTMVVGESYESSGVTYTVTDDGITVAGTSTGYSMTKRVSVKSILEVGKIYTLSPSYTKGVYVIFRSVKNGTADYSSTKTITGEETLIEVYLQVNPETTVNNVVIKPQLEEGAKATTYEPYGYKIPINVNGESVNIYLDKQLYKNGDYVDYMDYKQQSVFYYDESGNETKTSIALPSIQTIKGTNIITTGTSISPSNIKVKYIAK